MRSRFFSQKVFIKLFCKSQFPYKFVNLFLIIVMVKDKLADLYRNRLLQNNFINVLCEMKFPSCPLLWPFLFAWRVSAILFSISV